MAESKTWAQVKATFAPPIERVELCSRPDLADRIEALKKEHTAAKATDDLLNEPDRAPGIADEIERLRGEALKSTVTFVLQGISHHALEHLRQTHPPTPEQQQLAEANNFHLPHNPDTFEPAVIDACCIEPTGMTLDDWIELYASFTEGQLARFRLAVNKVNFGVTDVPKGVSGSEKTPGTATS